MLQLDDHWVWDFWFAHRGGRHHVFFLKAPKSLVDPDLRHWNARIGHAVSDDLRTWEVLDDALEPGPPGSWDDRATWTGNVIEHDGRWYMFYSGVDHAHDGLVQRIGVATSPDLTTWHKRPDPLLEPDPRWYEQLDLDVWIEETWRDPWVFREPGGTGWLMCLTARAHHGPVDGRGVVGQARSDDLTHWEVLPPLTEPGDFAHLEVPQVVSIGEHWYLVFSVYDWAHSAVRLARAAQVYGTHYMISDSPVGPFRLLTDEFLLGSKEGRFYAGRLVQDHRGEWQFMCWAQFDDRGGFVGALTDPVPIKQGDDGSLQLAHEPGIGGTDLVREVRPPGGGTGG